MASARQVAANRLNGLKGGVKTEEGKAVSRLNARKHSIFVAALTEEDSDEVRGYEDQLIASLRPVGRVEEMLVEKIALTWLRIQRCARAEGEYHISISQTPNPMKLIDLYDNRLTNQFLKLLHEVERLQGIRKSENGAAASEDKGDSCSGASAPENAAKSPAAGVDAAPVPAATETSCPPSQPPSFTQSPIVENFDTGSTVQAPEHVAASAIETLQDAAGEKDDAQETI
jgi:hypothetical protein